MDVPPPIVSAILPLSSFDAMEAYERMVLRKKKGVWSDVTRAQRLGYSVGPFPWPRHLTDVVAINRSLPERQGRSMGSSYLMTVEEMGGEDPDAELPSIACPLHWRQTFGAFAPNGRLVAYCRLIRSDNLVMYTAWLGHGDHLAAGIMHLLHHGVMHYLLARSVETQGLDGLMYAGWNDGLEGLKAWKARLGFAPRRTFDVCEVPVALPHSSTVDTCRC